MAYQAGQAYIQVNPSLKNFHRKIRSELSKELAGINAEIPVGADTSAARREVDALRAELRQLRDANVNVDVDSGAAQARIAEIEGRLRALGAQDATVDVDADTAGASAQLTAIDQQAGRLDGRNVNVDVNVDRDGSAQRGAFFLANQINGLVLASAAVAPAVVPALGAATVAVGGLGSALAAAGAGAAGFGLAAAPSISAVTEAVKLQDRAQQEMAATGEVSAATSERLGAALEGLSPLQRSLMQGWLGLRDAFNKWAEALEPAVIPVFLQGMELLERLLPNLTPLVEATATAFSSLLTQAGKALESPFWQRFFQFLADTAGPAISMFGQVLGNLAKGFAGLLMAFAPVAESIGAGLVGLTERFAAWGETLGANEGFKNFVDYVREIWPQLKATFAALWGAIRNIVAALAPLAGPALAGLEAIANVIGEMPPGLLAAIAGGLLGIGAAFKVVGAAMAVLRANPIILVIAAVTALATWLVHTYQTSETFRNVVNAAFRKVGEITRGVARFIKRWVIDPLVAGFRWIMDTAGNVRRGVVIYFGIIKDRVIGAYRSLKRSAIDPLIRGFQSVKDKAVAIKDGIVDAFRTMRDAAGQIFGGLIDKITGPVRTVIKWINKHMIGNLNKVTTRFGLDIPTIPVPRGSAGKNGGGGGRQIGGGSFNTGGLVPGGGPDRDSVSAYLTPGEGIVTRSAMRGIAAEMGTSPAGAITAINQGAMPTGGDKGIDPNARGGPFDFIGDIASGAWDGIQAIGSQVGSWLRKGAAFALDKVMTPIVSGVKHVIPGPEFVQRAMRGMLNEGKQAMVAWGRGEDKKSEGTDAGKKPGGVPDMSGGRWAFPLPRGSYRVGGGLNSYPGHTGQDFPAPAGTPVFAPFAGQLDQVSMLGSYGTHSNIYAGPHRVISAHLSSHVGGDRAVRKGELIGRVGSTGNSTGNHLHQEVRENGSVRSPSNYWSFDNGGDLPRGLTLAFNGTGQRERVLDPQETRAYERGRGITNNIYGTPKQLVSDVVFAQRVNDMTSQMSGV